MTQYTIRVLNNSAVDKSYFAFMQPPVVSSNGSPTVYSNVWAPFPGITQGGWDTASYNDTTYAYWAQPAEASSPNTVVNAGGVVPVDTVTTDTAHFSNALGETGSVSPGASPGMASPDSVSIISTTDFTPNNGFVLGVARDNGSSVPSPVATFDAVPNEIYNIAPVTKFYVADGNYQPGQVIDVTTMSNQYAVIDFTNHSTSDTTTVTRGLNGAFTVKF